MEVKMLGSGSWEGIPAPFCNCRVCESSKRHGSKDNRTRPELLIETSKGKFLIEISPDFRIQSSQFNLPNITDFLISHWHFDHMYGLLELHSWAKSRAGKKPLIYCSQKTKEWLDRSFAHIPKEVIVLEPYKKFELYGVNITPIPVYHMHEQDKNIGEKDLNNSFGYILEANGRKISYLGDYYKVPNKSIELIKGSDVIIADGTFLFEELFPKRPQQSNLKSDPDHIHGKEIFDFVRSLEASKIIFHSIAHLPEKTHEELQKMLPENMFISYDGMII